jgi:hypothetical protein
MHCSLMSHLYDARCPSILKGSFGTILGSWISSTIYVRSFAGNRASRNRQLLCSARHQSNSAASTEAETPTPKPAKEEGSTATASKIRKVYRAPKTQAKPGVRSIYVSRALLICRGLYGSDASSTSGGISLLLRSRRTGWWFVTMP